MPTDYVSDVARIAAMDNPVLRNLEITECYAHLSTAMRPRTGGAADWCTFATWASRQAGSTIRGEDLLDHLDRRLGKRAWFLAPIASFNRMLLRKGLFQPGTTPGRIVAEIHSPFDAFEHASAEVALGNLKVFAEIGRECARFLAAVPADAREDSPEFVAFASELRPGPPPDGQDGVACAAADWCDLAQRMHYITHLFRAYAETASLFTRPFTKEQVATFRAGKIPSGDM